MAAAAAAERSSSRRFHNVQTTQWVEPPDIVPPDHWIQESIKQIINSGLFWETGAAE